MALFNLYSSEGFPESVVAAALSRVGMKVLHLDRNDYYSDQWATFTFDSLLKWIDLNQSGNQADANEGKDNLVGTGTQESEMLSLESGTYSVPVPSHSDEIKNVVVKSYFCKKIEIDPCDVKEGSTGSSEAAMTNSVPQNISNEKEKSGDEVGSLQEALHDSRASGEETGFVGGEEADTVHSCSDEAENAGGSAVESEVNIQRPTGVVETAQEASEGQNGVSHRNEDSNGSAQRLRSETKPTIGVNMTYDDLRPYWRRFNIDLSPKLLFSRGPLVEALISANISHYAEFKSVTRILTYLDGRAEDVPCSRADVFSSNVISIVEKRMLMKFLTFCLDYEQQQDQYEEFEDRPYSEFLQSRRLTPNLQHFIIHAIAMVKPETTTVTGLKATQSFLQSLGRYGNTPFIWPLYGAGELPQAFCRMCAVFGGLYCLRRAASAITVNKDTNQCTGTISNNQLLKCKWLITGYSYVPEIFRKECLQFVSRAVFITSGSVKASDEEFITVLSMPPSCKEAEPVRVIELGPSTMACPKGLYIVHFVSKSLSSAEKDLKLTANKLFHFLSEDEGDAPSDKPTVLWSMYFNQAISDSSCVVDLPSNIHVLSLPGVNIGFGEALFQAKEVFEKICPGEEFLQRVPNPEDIILDDFLQDGNQSAAEPEGAAPAVETEPGISDEENKAFETRLEDKKVVADGSIQPDKECEDQPSSEGQQNRETDTDDAKQQHVEEESKDLP